jgi:hypothetical protein
VTFPLEQIQRWMQSVIMHPGGVAEGVESAAARQHIDLAATGIDSVVSRSAALDSVERMEIYARAYYARLVECMEAEFPVVSRSVGEDLFQEFAVGYLERYPSRSYTLNHLGAHFADYLAETFPHEDPESASLAFLIDLARLEWHFNEVFDGPGAEQAALLNADQLSQIAPQDWADLRLVPVPCLRLAQLDYPVQDYYRAVRDNADAQPPQPGKTRLAITRREYIVRHYPVSVTQYAILAEILAGANMGQAVERAAALADAERLAQLAEQLRAWFRFWSAEGFFLAVE